VRLAGFSVYECLANFPQVLDVLAINAHRMHVLDVQANRHLEWGGSTWQRIAGGNLASISVGIDASLFALDSGRRLWSRIVLGDWVQIDAADRYHVCGITVSTSSQNNVWTGAGVAVGADHHLRRSFRAARVGDAGG
jgi:hypothetical protein